MKSFLRKTAVVLAGSMGAFALSVAFAAWVSTGTGSGSAKATQAQELTTVDASASATAQLYPGGTGGLKITINNPNPYPVKVTKVEGSGPITGAGGLGTCATTGVTYTDQTGLSLAVGAGSSETFTLANSVAMSNASDSGCQGATFTIPVTLTGESNAS